MTSIYHKGEVHSTATRTRNPNHKRLLAKHEGAMKIVDISTITINSAYKKCDDDANVKKQDSLKCTRYKEPVPFHGFDNRVQE